MPFSGPGAPGVGRYDQVVSLGRGCQPAHQIRRLLGTSAAHLFDWIITTDRGLVTLVASDLAGFFRRDGLAIGPTGVVTDVHTETQFLHEFPKGADVDALYESHAGRVAMLAGRWRELLASDQRVLFVRQHAWDPHRRASATRLRDAIRERSPRLHFDILYLTADPEPSWNEHGTSSVS